MALCVTLQVLVDVEGALGFEVVLLLLELLELLCKSF